MKINTRVRYGMRAILRIADAYEAAPVSINSISESEEISGKYLEQVVSPLRRAGLVISHKGVKGGYSLSRPPAEISLLDVINALDMHPELVECVRRPEICDRAPECVAHQIWCLLDARLREFWRGISLSDLLAEFRTKDIADLGVGEVVRALDPDDASHAAIVCRRSHPAKGS
jgi:Rrf2 family protein